jgi:hypothetical protein
MVNRDYEQESVIESIDKKIADVPHKALEDLIVFILKVPIIFCVTL